MKRLFGFKGGKRDVAKEEALAKGLDEAALALEEGRFDEAQHAAERVLEREARSGPGWHFLAEARAGQGDVEGARLAFAKGLAAAPEDLELAFAYAELLTGPFGDDAERVQEALTLCVRGRKRAAKGGDTELERDFLVVEGIARNLLGDHRLALEALDAALKTAPGHLVARQERALALFELCLFSEAEEALRALAREEPRDPHTLSLLALVLERRGAEAAEEARQLLAQAHALSPADFPLPVELGDETFDNVVEDALRRLPEDVRHHLENVTVVVEPLPPEEELLAADPPLSPTILGLFRGTPVGERSITRAEDHFPAAIALYQRNLERFARTREELIEQIGITVMHEFGHLIGLDEDDLAERGLD